MLCEILCIWAVSERLKRFDRSVKKDRDVKLPDFCSLSLSDEIDQPEI